jgi:hypothetical protein
MRKKIFMTLLFVTPVFFFFGIRLLDVIIGRDNQESLTGEIIGALLCGYGGSLGLWYLYRKANKGKKE